MINVISYNLKIKSLKERYVFLTEILKGIDRNQISYEDIFSFLNQKVFFFLIFDIFHVLPFLTFYYYYFWYFGHFGYFHSFLIIFIHLNIWI